MLPYVGRESFSLARNEVVRDVVDDARQQRLLITKVIVNERFADPRLASDVAEREVGGAAG
ncbi:MAG TPA: hypothetical protein VJO33_12960 [Gemmatimonadaceae bacterium]|nr:hypothetical protein [Gemmatimonadaceae bacterium]